MQNIFSVFKGWLADATAFLRTNPLTTFFLIVVILVYGLMFFTHQEKQEEPSKAMQQIQMVEEKLKDKEEAQALKEFILEKAGPFELTLLVLVPLVLFLALIVGMYLDVNLAGKLYHKKEIISSVTAHAEAVPWGISEIVKSVIYVLFAGIVISLFSGVVQGLLFGKEKIYENIFLIFHTVFLDLFILFFVCYLVGKKWQDNLNALGLRFIEFGKDIWLGFSSYIALLPLVVLSLLILVFAAELISYEPPPHPLIEIFVEEDYKNPALIYFSIFLACTLGPIIEEIFFRGFCYPAFKKKWGTQWAMVLSSGFFALIHNSAFAFFPVFVLGLGFAYVYEKRGTLIPSIVMHILHNSIFIGYFFLLKRSVLDQLIQS